MSYLATLLSQDTITALGWMLIHSLWQAAVTALSLALALHLLKKHSARLRYAIALSSLAFLALLPVLTFLRYQQTSALQEETYSLSYSSMHAPAVQAASEPLPETGFALLQLINDNLLAAVMCWLAGVLFLTFRMIGGWVYVQRIRRSSTRPDSSWQYLVDRLGKEIGLTQKVKVLESAWVKIPMAVGYLKPLILLPAGALTGLSIRQVEAILAHELAHIHRNDYIVNILQSALEILFFFNPFFWWISRIVRRERENCCDDVAVKICGDSLLLARALTSLEEFRQQTPALAVAFTGKGHLLGRILRIVNPTQLKPSLCDSLAATGVLVLSLFVLSFSATAGVKHENKSAKAAQDTTYAPAAAPAADSPTPAEQVPPAPEFPKSGETTASEAPPGDTARTAREENERTSGDQPGTKSLKEKEKAKNKKSADRAAQNEAYTKAMEEFRKQMEAFNANTAKTGKADMEEFGKAMEQFGVAMKELDQSMQQIHSELSTIGPGPRYSYSYQYPAPPAPPAAPVPPFKAPEKMNRKMRKKHEEMVRKREEKMWEKELEIRLEEAEIHRREAERRREEARERGIEAEERAREAIERARERGIEAEERAREALERAREAEEERREEIGERAKEAEERMKEAEERREEAEERRKEALERRKEAEERRKEAAVREKKGIEMEKAFESALKADKLIKDENHYTFKIDAEGLSVNGEKQPAELHKKYMKLVKKLVGEDIKGMSKSKDKSSSSNSTSISITR